MKMTEHQQRLWQRMIELIQSYLDGQTDDFYGIVGMLEGALDASEIKDQMFIDEWYNFWTPLETRRSLEGSSVNKDMAIKELSAMKTFLLREGK